MPLDIERWIVAASPTKQGFVGGRMSPLTAFLFILLPIALLLSSPRRAESRGRARIAQIVAAAIFVVAGILIVGYWHGAQTGVQWQRLCRPMTWEPTICEVPSPNFLARGAQCLARMTRSTGELVSSAPC